MKFKIILSIIGAIIILSCKNETKQLNNTCVVTHQNYSKEKYIKFNINIYNNDVLHNKININFKLYATKDKNNNIFYKVETYKVTSYNKEYHFNINVQVVASNQYAEIPKCKKIAISEKVHFTDIKINVAVSQGTFVRTYTKNSVNTSIEGPCRTYRINYIVVNTLKKEPTLKIFRTYDIPTQFNSKIFSLPEPFVFYDITSWFDDDIIIEIEKILVSTQ